MTTEKEALRFLCEAGAASRDHSGLVLLAHLIGTYTLLQAWRARRDVALAGLFHSVYGTEFLTTPLVDRSRRAEVRKLIGADAERLVDLFGLMDLNTLAEAAGGRSPLLSADWSVLPASRQDVTDLAWIAAANWLEQSPRIAPANRAIVAARVEELRHVLPEMAIRGCQLG